MRRGLLLLVIISAAYWSYVYYSPNKKNTRSEEIHAANLQILESGIMIFTRHEKRPPAALTELVAKKYIDTLPDDGGIEWRYDPAEGKAL